MFELALVIPASPAQCRRSRRPCLAAALGPGPVDPAWSAGCSAYPAERAGPFEGLTLWSRCGRRVPATRSGRIPTALMWNAQLPAHPGGLLLGRQLRHPWLLLAPWPIPAAPQPLAAIREHSTRPSRHAAVSSPNPRCAHLVRPLHSRRIPIEPPGYARSLANLAARIADWQSGRPALSAVPAPHPTQPLRLANCLASLAMRCQCLLRRPACWRFEPLSQQGDSGRIPAGHYGYVQSPAILPARPHRSRSARPFPAIAAWTHQAASSLFAIGYAHQTRHLPRPVIQLACPRSACPGPAARSRRNSTAPPRYAQSPGTPGNPLQGRR